MHLITRIDFVQWKQVQCPAVAQLQSHGFRVVSLHGIFRRTFHKQMKLEASAKIPGRGLLWNFPSEGEIQLGAHREM